jgi:DNA transformation protein
MPVGTEYRDFVLEQLEAVGPISPKSLFGGIGLYRDGLFFGLLYNEALYFKVDDATRPDFERAGMSAFKPYAGKAASRQYYQVPPEVLEDGNRLVRWAHKAIEAAGRPRVKKPAKRKSAAVPRRSR